MHILLLDNYDSFTWNLHHLLEPHAEVDVVRNDAITVQEAAAYDRIVLSPGPGLPNEAGIMIAQNGADNDFNPGLWSQFTFIVDGSDTYMCQTPYGAENENAAICAEAPDAANLESGCDGFAWSKLTKK